MYRLLPVGKIFTNSVVFAARGMTFQCCLVLLHEQTKMFLLR